MRLLNGKSDHPTSSKAYFDASKYKLERQLVIQGQFKESGINMSQVWIGDIFDRKFKFNISPRVARFGSKLFTKLALDIVIDLVSQNPKILALIGSGSHTISVDEVGTEPDIRLPELPENANLSNNIKSSHERKRILRKT